MPEQNLGEEHIAPDVACAQSGSSILQLRFHAGKIGTSYAPTASRSGTIFLAPCGCKLSELTVPLRSAKMFPEETTSGITLASPVEIFYSTIWVTSSLGTLRNARKIFRPNPLARPKAEAGLSQDFDDSYCAAREDSLSKSTLKNYPQGEQSIPFAPHAFVS